LGGFETRGDVGKGDDQSAAGHPVGAHLDHQMTVRQAFQIRLALGGVGRQPPLHQLFAVAKIGRVGRAHEFKDFAQRNADLDQIRRQRENFAELPVGTDQLQIRVEHRYALPDMVQRGLQDFAIEMQRGVGVVQQLERGLGGDRALAQQQRHHQARRRSPDRRSDQMLGVLQQLEIRGRRRFEIGAARGCEGFERMPGAVGTEILRHRALVTVVRQRRNAGVIGVSSFGTNRSACNRSIEDGCRARESTM
jgi:hypothetical protein